MRWFSGLTFLCDRAVTFFEPSLRCCERIVSIVLDLWTSPNRIMSWGLLNSLSAHSSLISRVVSPRTSVLSFRQWEDTPKGNLQMKRESCRTRLLTPCTTGIFKWFWCCLSLQHCMMLYGLHFVVLTLSAFWNVQYCT